MAGFLFFNFRTTGDDMARSTVPAVPAHLTVMRGWIGTKEVPGKGTNPIIAGKNWSWSGIIDRFDVTTDEVPNCASAVGASLVLGEFYGAGLSLDTLKDDPSKRASALLAERGIFVPLPPNDKRLLARGYSDYGIDARKSTAPGDIGVLPRGAAWQGHVVLLDTYLGNGRWRCIGANQSDTTSYAEHHVSEFVAIRRYVPPTVKDLRAAGSKAIERGDMVEAAGYASAAGGFAIAAGGEAISATAPAAEAVAVHAPNVMEPIATGAGQALSITNAGSALGQLFIQNPWLVMCIGLGVTLIYLGRTGKLKRVKDYIHNAVLSQHQPGDGPAINSKGRGMRVDLDNAEIAITAG